MKKLLTIVVVSLMVTFVFAEGQKEGNSADSFVIKVGYGTAGGPIHEAALEFEKRIEAADPRVDVQIFSGGQLGSEGEIIGQLQSGVTDMLPTTTGPLGQYDPIFYVLESPFVFLNEKQVDQVLDGPVGEVFLNKLEDRGLIGLAFWENGFRQITNSKRPILAPEDLDGIKLRTMQNKLHMRYFSSLGANPTPLPFTEVYNSLATKVVDGQENPFSLIATNKFYEQQDYVSKTDHVYSAVPVYFSAKKWAELPVDVQELVRGTVYELRLWERERGRTLQNEYLDEIKTKSDVFLLTDAQKAAFQEKAQDSYKWAAKEYGDAYASLLEELLIEAAK